MPNVLKRETVKEVNFLASARFQSFTYQADKTYKAGDIYPSNDDKAVGIVINHTEVDGTSQPIGVIVEGYILEERLATKPTEEAKTAMKEIKWR